MRLLECVYWNASIGMRLLGKITGGVQRKLYPINPISDKRDEPILRMVKHCFVGYIYIS